MPVWLRTFYYKKTEEALSKEKQQAKNLKKSKNKISKPSIAPKRT
jgi:hypothetical protein